jgi:glycosyltransferase involved in cell wall biosynthesis
MTSPVAPCSPESPDPSPVGDAPKTEPGLVSVVMPTYNRAYIIARAIESILGQTYPFVEVIVADDGSTDDTKEVVARYDDRVRYVRQSNAGVSAARNLGLRHAGGEFVGFLDSDDTWLPWKVEAQVSILRRYPEIGMVWSDMRAVDERGALVQEAYLRTFYRAYNVVDIARLCQMRGRLEEIWPGAPPQAARCSVYSGDIFSAMFSGNLVHTSTVLLKRERLLLVGEFDTGLSPSGEDYEYHLRTSYFGPVGFLDASSIEYRVGASDQLTAPAYLVHIARNNLTTLERWLERGKDRLSMSPAQVEERLGASLAWLGEEEYWARRHADARRHLWRALRMGARRRRRLAILLALTLLPHAAFTVAFAAWKRALALRPRRWRKRTAGSATQAKG